MKPSDGAPGIITTDSTGRIAAMNEAAGVLLKTGSSRAVGRQIKEIMPDSRLTDVYWTDRTDRVEHLTVHGRSLAISRTPVYDGARLSGSIYVLQDVSGWDEIRNELKQLRHDKNELEAIFDASFDEIFVIDGKGVTQKINRAGESFYGVGTDELIGRNVLELEEQGFFSPSVARMIFEQKERVTIAQTTRSGKELIVTGNPVFDDQGNIVRIVINSRDVSELTELRRRLMETERLAEAYRRQLVELESDKSARSEIVAHSEDMLRLLAMADRVAGVDSTVLITGESGVGKGIVAGRIHRLSRRGEGPFVSINCGAIPENLLESELFGYAPGAFTGAQRAGKKGLIQMGEGGTVFLDEVAELPLNLQVKLLHVIQQKSVTPVGGTAPQRVDARFIAATNRDIKQMVRDGEFREDLYYRLNVIPLEVSPLRHRLEDILPLAEHCLDAINKKYGIGKKLAPETRELLLRYNWPGNVRELENIIERVAVTADAVEIKPAHLPDYILNHLSRQSNKIYVPDICPLDDAVRDVERQLVEKAYERYGNTYQMAEALGINQSTVVRKMKRYMFGTRRKPGPRPR